MKKRLKKSIHTVQQENKGDTKGKSEIDDKEINENIRILPRVLGNIEDFRGVGECGDFPEDPEERQAYIRRHILSDEETEEFDDSGENFVRLLDEMDSQFLNIQKELSPSPNVPEKEVSQFPFWGLDRLYQAFTGEKPLPEIAPGIPDSLPIDHHLPQLLKRLTQTDDLTEVTKIKLKVVSREMSLSRLAIFLPNLTELDLEGSYLSSFRDLGVDMNNLKILRVGNCGLSALDGMFGLQTVRELYAPDNNIDDLGCAARLPNLEVLDLSRNTIKTITSVILLRACENLKHLNLEGNPCTNQPLYKEQIQGWLPKLAKLDDTLIQNSGHDEELSKLLRPPPPMAEKKTSSYAANITCKARKKAEDMFKNLEIHSSDESIPEEMRKIHKKTNQVFEEIAQEAYDLMKQMAEDESDDIEEASPSTTQLPEGHVLYGNLTQVLSRVQRPPRIDKEEREAEKKALIKKKEIVKIYDSSSEEEVNEKREQRPRRRRPANLLDESKEFRDKFNAYREKNKTKWEQEEGENEGSKESD